MSPRHRYTDWTGAKLCALAHSRCSTSLRLKSFGQSGSGAVITTSHNSVMHAGSSFAFEQPVHGCLGFFAGLAESCPSGHDPVVVPEADPPAGHVQPVRVQHGLHSALGANRPVDGRVPAHQDLVVP